MNALWTYSKQLLDDRCTLIHSPDPTSKPSLKIKEIRKELKEELDWLKTSNTYDDKQLVQNIE